MARLEQRLTFDEFAHNLQGIFDALTARKGAVVVDRGGELFRVEHQPADRPVVAPPRDPELVRAVLQQTAGAFKTQDVAKLKRDLRAQRGQRRRGRPNDY